jgi:predicted phage terminase large subunit-like protein
MVAVTSARSREERAAPLAREYLYSFVMQAWQSVDPAPFKDNWHIGCMCEYLEAVADGEIPKLVINVPPGHQKSLTVSVFWPVWTWIRRPQKRFMATAYRGDLALRDAQKSRDLIRSPWFQRHFGSSFQLAGDQDTKSRYQNNKGGYRFSTSVAGIMGEGGDFVILDDPHNVEQAESDVVRDETVRKIDLALPTRVRSPDGGTVVIMQRLHSRDYCGRQIEQHRDQWVHVCLPARYEYDHPSRLRSISLPSGRTLPGDARANPQIQRKYDRLASIDTREARDAAALLAADHNGELLFPALFSEQRQTALEDALGSYGTAGQQQQRPAPREGGLFRRAWFADQMIDARDIPAERIQVRGWDLAGSTRKTSPYTAGVRVSMAGGKYYIEHVSRERWTPAAMEEGMLLQARLDGYGVHIDVPQDPGQAGKSQVQALSRKLAGFVMRSSPESGAKEQRAEPFSAQCEAGNVYIVRDSWSETYLEELCSFPRGQFADQVDASSRAFARLLHLGGLVSTGASSGSY